MDGGDGNNYGGRHLGRQRAGGGYGGRSYGGGNYGKNVNGKNYGSNYGGGQDWNAEVDSYDDNNDDNNNNAMKRRVQHAKTLLEVVVTSGGSRQVVAASVATLFHLLERDGEKETASKEMLAHANIMEAGEEILGPQQGVSQICRVLKTSGYTTLAANVSNQHRCRNMLAHPVPDLAIKVRNALITCKTNTCEEAAHNGNDEESGGNVCDKAEHNGNGEEGGGISDVDPLNTALILSKLEEMTKDMAKYTNTSLNVNIDKWGREAVNPLPPSHSGQRVEAAEAVNPLPPSHFGQRVEAADIDTKVKDEYGDPQSS